MLSIVFATVAVTGLMLSMKSTRLWGTLALFVMLATAPVLTSLLLIVVAAVACFIFDKPKWESIVRKLPWLD